MRLCEQRQNIEENHVEKSELTHHSFEAIHKVSWDEVWILGTGSNNRYVKSEKSAHTTCLSKLFSQPSPNIPSLWIPLTDISMT
jgi:hypothetical protein